MSVKSSSQDFNLALSGLLTAPVGYLVLLFLPVYLEILADSRSLSELEVGRLASTDSVGIVFATLAFALLVNQLNFRKVTQVGVLLAVMGNLLSLITADFTLLCITRVVAGIGEGLLVAVGISAIGMTANPNRWFGIYTAVVVLVQALGLVMLPLVNNLGGEQGIFLAIALFYLIPVLVIKRLPLTSQSHDRALSESVSTIETKVFLIALAGLLCFYIGIGGIWSFISFVGTDAGLDLQYVANSLSLSMIAGLAGALFFAWLGKRGSSHSLLLLSVVVMIVSLWLLELYLTAASYLLLLSLFSFFWSIVGARTFAIISDADPSGKYISSAQTLVGVGYIIGPLVAAQMVNQFSYQGLYMLGAVVFLSCFTLMLPLAKRSA